MHATQDEPFSLVMFDIDHFKRVNDTHGHGAGDDVLRVTAEAIQGSIRAVDKAFRIGGEEFAVLMAGADAPGAFLGAERLRRTIADRVIKTSGTDISVTVSLGVASARPDATLEQLCREADRALYAAKTSGRNRTVTAATHQAV